MGALEAGGWQCRRSARLPILETELGASVSSPSGKLSWQSSPTETSWNKVLKKLAVQGSKGLYDHDCAYSYSIFKILKDFTDGHESLQENMRVSPKREPSQESLLIVVQGRILVELKLEVVQTLF